MEDDDPHAIEGVLLYLYTKSYPEWPDYNHCKPTDGAGSKKSKLSLKSIVPESQWQSHLVLFCLADKLGLDALKVGAQEKLEIEIRREWAASDFNDLLAQLWELEQDGAEQLRASALNVVAINAAALVEKPEFKEYLYGGSEFASGFREKLITEHLQKMALEEEITALKETAKIADEKTARRKAKLDAIITSWDRSRSSYAQTTNRRAVEELQELWASI